MPSRPRRKETKLPALGWLRKNWRARAERVGRRENDHVSVRAEASCEVWCCLYTVVPRLGRISNTAGNSVKAAGWWSNGDELCVESVKARKVSITRRGDSICSGALGLQSTRAKIKTERERERKEHDKRRE